MMVYNTGIVKPFKAKVIYYIILYYKNIIWRIFLSAEKLFFFNSDLLVNLFLQ